MTKTQLRFRYLTNNDGGSKRYFGIKDGHDLTSSERIEKCGHKN